MPTDPSRYYFNTPPLTGAPTITVTPSNQNPDGCGRPDCPICYPQGAAGPHIQPPPQPTAPAYEPEDPNAVHNGVRVYLRWMFRSLVDSLRRNASTTAQRRVASHSLSDNAANCSKETIVGGLVECLSEMAGLHTDAQAERYRKFLKCLYRVCNDTGSDEVAPEDEALALYKRLFASLTASMPPVPHRVRTEEATERREAAISEARRELRQVHSWRQTRQRAALRRRHSGRSSAEAVDDGAPLRARQAVVPTLSPISGRSFTGQYTDDLDL